MSTVDGTRVAVFGVANEQSIAWQVARHLSAGGAEVHISYQQRFRSRVMQLIRGAGDGVAIAGLHRCDVTDADSVASFFEAVGGPLHGIVHSVAFAPFDNFGRPIQDNPAADFGTTLEVSAWSLLHLARHAVPYLAPSAAVVAMTYLGAQRVVPGYRMMGVAKAALEACVRELAVELGPRGVRVNAVSAGPIRTLASSAVADFDELLKRYADIAPMRRTVEADDVARMTGFLLSEAARNVTGQTLYVDAGYSVLAVTR